MTLKECLNFDTIFLFVRHNYNLPYEIQLCLFEAYPTSIILEA